MADRPGRPTAAPFVPPGGDLAALAAAAFGCQGCELHERASQAVFGEGPANAEVVLIGEQPGDMEDRQGRPFVGPAGRLLDRALGDAGIARDSAYVTNAVKHFRWKPPPGGGKRRIHVKPDLRHVSACRPWLDAELARLLPRVVVTPRGDGGTGAVRFLVPGHRGPRPADRLAQRAGQCRTRRGAHRAPLVGGPGRRPGPRRGLRRVRQRPPGRRRGLDVAATRVGKCRCHGGDGGP